MTAQRDLRAWKAAAAWEGQSYQMPDHRINNAFRANTTATFLTESFMRD